MIRFQSLVCLLLVCLAALAAAQGSSNGARTRSRWQTLGGNAPLVIARGGFSGIFPDSSEAAYQLAGLVSLPNVIYWCDVQLTKDGAGICFPDLRLDNGSNIEHVFQNKRNTYSVNGAPMQGWFSVDFTLDDLANVFSQGVHSRLPYLDGNMYAILTVQYLVMKLNPPAPGIWLNIQHDAFFSERNLSMKSFILSIFRSAIVDYISSPEVNFLRSILARKPRKTKLIFQFLDQDKLEPSTNQTYGSLLSNFTFIKTFASGILVPKTYIWRVDNLYLQNSTSVVLDAHKEGLEVFASDFANDATFAYNFSYNPLAEYMYFIDNRVFSVDGVVSDFPITPSAAIACFSHIGRNVSGQEKPLVISSKGSSGDYPGCTDLAYRQAIFDGVNVIDCPVQMTKDGVPFCLGSINLMDHTNIAQSNFSNLSTSIPQLGIVNGIFTFNLKWNDIQTLKPYLVEKQNLKVTDAVLDVLKNVSPNNQTVKKIMIQSPNSSVLMEFKEKSSYELVYSVTEDIRDADNSTIIEITKFADSVVVTKSSVFPDDSGFLTGSTDVVQKIKAFKLPVYVQLFRNEFLSQAWDFLADPNVEINSYVQGAGIDGVITEFPGTAAKYKRNRCLGLGDKTPFYMSPVEPGSLLKLIGPSSLPPAPPPYHVLSEDDVAEPPLPSAAEIAPTPGNNTVSLPPAQTLPSGQPKFVASIFLSSLAVLLATFSLSLRI